jgi:hypothetical protein
MAPGATRTTRARAKPASDAAEGTPAPKAAASTKKAAAPSSAKAPAAAPRRRQQQQQQQQQQVDSGSDPESEPQPAAAATSAAAPRPPPPLRAPGQYALRIESPAVFYALLAAPLAVWWLSVVSGLLAYNGLATKDKRVVHMLIW